MNAARNGRGRPAGAARRRWQTWVAGGTILTLVTTLAVVVAGFDSRETPREDPSVWVARSSGQYARVNTETAEIDTVRMVESPSSVVQSGGLGLLLTQGFGRAWPIDPSAPRDIQDASGGDTAETGTDSGRAAAGGDAQPASDTEAGDDGAEASGIRTPDGTRLVIAAGDRVLFHTEAGAAYLAAVTPDESGGSTLGVPTLLDPFADESGRASETGEGAEAEADGEESAADAAQEQAYQAVAAALDANGSVALFSPAEQGIRWYDAAGGRFRGGLSAVPDEVAAEGVQLAIVAGKWVLFDAEQGLLWREGVSEPTLLDVTGVALLQGSSTAAAGDDALVADEAGLWAVDRDGVAERVAEVRGVPARPQQAGELVAAWVDSSGAGLWTQGAGLTALELDETVEDLADPDPVIRTNGGRALLADTRSGMMWTVPDGRLIPVEQWALVDPPKNQQGEVITQDVAEQEPPVAVDDAFGVRPGEPTLLPVLLNDFDPNRKDVLTVVTEGLGEGLPADFGTVAALSDGQGLTVQPGSAAQGSASFVYRITDGVTVSEPATVTLAVVDDAVNTAPQWCPVEGCQRSWPSPELAPGGTLVLPILEGWVDPEGDPMMLAEASAVNPADPVRVLVTADGRLAVRHTDVNAPDGDVAVRVRVVDARGESGERELRVRVRTGAVLELAPMAVTVKTGEAQLLQPLERATGGSGSFQLVDAVVQQGALSTAVNAGAGTVEATASAAGTAIVAVTVRDSVTEQEAASIIRVTAVDSRGAFAVPPLRAFVRPLADTTIDVLAALPGANARALTVQSATVRDGRLRADVIEHSRIRLSGATSDGQPGRIGSAELIVDEGGTTAAARLTVFQVPETAAGAIAVADTATVRAGSVVDIPVLDNDVAPPGERLVLHPEVGAPGVEGELAFASGGNVRYLAPEAPGTYTLSYTAYGASSPELGDVGHIRVTVVPTGANRVPQPETVTVRVAPGERVSATIPLSGVDPDGDRVRLVSVDAPDDPQLSATILPRTNAVQIEASASAARGAQTVSYTVRDTFGGEANGRLRLIVTDPDPGGGAPVVYSDYVRIARGASEPVTVRPLDNDLDPSGGTLELIAVSPNVPGGETSPEYAALTARLDTSRLDEGIVRIAGGEELGTVSFKYTVRSSKSKSTADGLIVVQVSERIGLQAPSVTDTVLSVRDRADFQRSGVDVVTDRVRWAGGDVGALELSLWGSAANRYSVSGSRIIGDYRAEGDLVPFRLAGLDAMGAEVESFGFLIVPPLDELRLALRADLPQISVDEDKSVDLRIDELLDLGPGDRVELDQTSFSTQRGQASCQATGTTTLRYTAGKDGPWSDSCTVRVRLAEQRSYTVLALPIAIVPRQPVVQLNPLTRTIAPGETQTIELNDMVGWQGGREGQPSDLQWQLGGAAAPFEVVNAGSTVTVTARADAVSGVQQAMTASVSGAGSSQAVLTLRVGEAAADNPRGGTVSLQCTVGSNCSAALVGIPGEHDPFAGKSGGGLELVSVSGGTCSYGNLQAAGNSLQVSWPDASGSGGRCTAAFTVRDAQGRTGTGSIELDAQGVPRAPMGITPVSADGSSVVLSVALSGEASHPAVTGVELIANGGSVGTCSIQGNQASCTVSNLTPGERQTYFARAINAVGPSAQTANGAETWAYRPPPPPTISATTLEWTDNTDPDKGRIHVDIGTSSAPNIVLTIDGAAAAISGNGIYELAPGNPVFKVFSVDDLSALPPGYTGGSGGMGEVATATAQSIGAPRAGTAELTLSGANRTDWSIETSGWDQNAGNALSFTYSIGGFSGSNSSGSGLAEHQVYSGTVSASNSYGVTSTLTTNQVTTGNQLPTLAGTYTVNPNPLSSGGWSLTYAANAPDYSPSPTGEVSFSGVGPGSPVGSVTQCAAGGVNCSVTGTVAPAGLEPLTMSLGSCVPWNGSDLPSHDDIAAHLNAPVGAPGLAYTLAAVASGNVTITWADSSKRATGTFTGALCAATPPAPPGPDGG